MLFPQIFALILYLVSMCNCVYNIVSEHDRLHGMLCHLCIYYLVLIIKYNFKKKPVPIQTLPNISVNFKFSINYIISY